MSETESDSENRPSCGCERCDTVNVANASNGIIQLVICETNDIDSYEAALQFIRDDLDERGVLDETSDHTGDA